MPLEIVMLAATAGLLLSINSLRNSRSLVCHTLPVLPGKWTCKLSCHQEPQGAWQDLEQKLREASRSLIEAIAVFAPLVLIIHSLGLSNDQSLFGSQLFFVARVAHALFHVIDIPYARTGAGMVSVVGILMTASILFYL